MKKIICCLEKSKFFPNPRKSLISFVFIFIICISLVYAQPQMPTTQIYGIINAADGSTIAFEKGGIEIGSGTIQDSKYGYDPIIFIDAAAGDIVDVFIEDVLIDTITLAEEGNVNIDISVPAPTEGEQPPTTTTTTTTGTRGGYIPSTNHTAVFSQFPQTFNVRSGDRILLDFNGVEHTIRVARLRFQNIELLINPTPSTLMLNVDDEAEVDLNDDGINDIAILYDGVEANRGVVIIRQVIAPQPPAPVVTPPPTLTPQPTPPPIPKPEPEPVVEEPAPKGFPWTIVIIIVILGILGGLGFVYYEMKRSHGALQQEKQQKTLQDQSFMRLQSYVQQTLQQGYTKEQIRQVLLKEGWSQNIVNQVLR